MRVTDSSDLPRTSSGKVHVSFASTDRRWWRTRPGTCTRRTLVACECECGQAGCVHRRRARGYLAVVAAKLRCWWPCGPLTHAHRAALVAACVRECSATLLDCVACILGAQRSGKWQKPIRPGILPSFRAVHTWTCRRSSFSAHHGTTRTRCIRNRARCRTRTAQRCRHAPTSVGVREDVRRPMFLVCSPLPIRPKGVFAHLHNRFVPVIRERVRTFCCHSRSTYDDTNTLRRYRAMDGV